MSDIVERLRWIGSRTSWESADQQCNEAADEIERLRAEVAALRADAKRYQFLRDRGWPFTFNGSPEDADAAIDAALRDREPGDE